MICDPGAGMPGWISLLLFGAGIAVSALGFIVFTATRSDE